MFFSCLVIRVTVLVLQLSNLYIFFRYEVLDTSDKQSSLKEDLKNHIKTLLAVIHADLQNSLRPAFTLD